MRMWKKRGLEIHIEKQCNDLNNSNVWHVCYFIMYNSLYLAFEPQLRLPPHPFLALLHQSRKFVAVGEVVVAIETDACCLSSSSSFCSPWLFTTNCVYCTFHHRSCIVCVQGFSQVNTQQRQLFGTDPCLSLPTASSIGFQLHLRWHSSLETIWANFLTCIQSCSNPSALFYCFIKQNISRDTSDCTVCYSLTVKHTHLAVGGQSLFWVTVLL